MPEPTDEHPSAVSGAMGLPFNEQIAFFRNKLGNLVPTERWDDITRDAHDSAFMVAGAAKADLLAHLAAAVDKAIAEGRGIEEFRRDFDAIVRKHGWTGWTGQGTIRGEAWRVRTILSTNAYTSYSAGRYAQLVAGDFPFWVYRHGGSLEPRPVHLSWDGMALPPAHEFWRTYYPPSDWGCSCYVVGARSAAGVRRLGGDPEKRLPDGWKAIDPSTGAPIGVGKGWDYAPGASVADQVNAIAGKVRHWDYAVAKAFTDALPAHRIDQLADAYRALPSTADDARRYAQRIYEPNPELPAIAPVRTLGLVRSDQAAAIGRSAGVDVGRFDYSLSEYEIRHIIRRHGDDAAEQLQGQRAVTPADYALLPQILRQAQPIGAGTSDVGRAVFLFRISIAGVRYEAVFELRTGRKTLALLSYRIGRD